MLLLSRPNGVLLVMFVLAVCQLVMGESIDQTEIVRDSPMHLPASETLKSRADAKPTRNLLNLLAYRSSRYVDHVHVLTLEHLRGSNVPRLSSKNTKLMDAETIKYLDKYTANELAKSAYQEVMNPDRNNRDLLYLRAYVGKLGNQSPSSALTSTQIKKARAITHAIDLAVAKDLLTKHMHLKAFKKELAEWSEFFNYLHFVMLRKESLSTKNLEAQSASDRATAEKKLALLSVLFLSSVDIRVAIEFLHRIPHPETHDPEIHHCTFHSTLRKMREIMPRGSSAALWNCRLKTAYSSALVHDQHAILDQFFKKLGSYAASFELTKALANSQQGSIKLASDDFERTYSLADTVHKFSQVLKKESEVIARLEQKGIFNFETAHEPHRGDFVRFAIQSAVALSRLNVIGLSSADPTTGLHFVGVSDTDVQKFTDFMEYTLKPTSRWPTFRFQRQPSQCVTCELTRSRQSHGKSKSSTVVTVTADE